MVFSTYETHTLAYHYISVFTSKISSLLKATQNLPVMARLATFFFNSSLLDQERWLVICEDHSTTKAQELGHHTNRISYRCLGLMDTVVKAGTPLTQNPVGP